MSGIDDDTILCNVRANTRYNSQHIQPVIFPEPYDPYSFLQRQLLSPVIVAIF
jgi:hypothetical protein